MKVKILALLATTVVTAAPALAQTAAPASPWSITGNLGLYSDYRFRGISQTDKQPALQGGFDIAHSTGIYVGNWNSNVDSAMYNGANLEMDFYGGYKYSAASGFGLDVGAIYYYYPGSGAGGSTKINNTELYIAGSYGPVSLKYSYAISDFFSAPDSKGSSYLDLSLAHDFGNGFGVNAHYGYQYLKGAARAAEIGGTAPGPDNISDWKLGGTYTLDGWVFGLAYIATNRNYTAGTAALTNKDISSGTAVVSVAKAF